MNRVEVPLLPFRIAVADHYTDGAGRLCCPVCGFDNVHIGPVQVQQGSCLTDIHSDETLVVASENKGRGSVVWVNFFCEAGHEWFYSFSFHKGSTTVVLGCDPEFNRHAVNQAEQINPFPIGGFEPETIQPLRPNKDERNEMPELWRD